MNSRLIEFYPESILVREHDGNLPVHLARKQEAVRAVLFFLRTNPTVAHIANAKGQLVLHIAASNALVPVSVVDKCI